MTRMMIRLRVSYTMAAGEKAPQEIKNCISCKVQLLQRLKGESHPVSFISVFWIRVLFSGSGSAKKSGSYPENPDLIRKIRIHEKTTKKCKYKYKNLYIIFSMVNLILFGQVPPKPKQRT